MKTSAKAGIPAICVFVAFGYIAWRISHPDYKIEIVVHGPDGQIVPAVGRAPR